jgi:hypothetical protein
MSPQGQTHGMEKGLINDHLALEADLVPHLAKVPVICAKSQPSRR